TAARSSAEKALAEDKESDMVKRVMENIDAAEKIDIAEKERLKKEEEARKKKEEEEKKKAETEAEARQKSKRIAEYLKDAEASLGKKDFTAARSSAEKALAEDKESDMVKRVMENIDAAEKIDIAEKERLKSEEEARIQQEKEAEKERLKQEDQRRLAEKEAKKLALKQEEERKAKERIDNYLGAAKKALADNNFNAAWRDTRKVLVLDENNAEAKALLEEIKKGQEDHNKLEREKLKANEDQKKPAEAKELNKKANKVEKLKKKSEKFMEKSNLNLKNRKYSEARRYAFLARNVYPENENVNGLLTEIDKEEMFNIKMKEGELNQEKAQKTFAKPVDIEAPLSVHNEARGWMQRVADVFSMKTYGIDLGPKEGKVYTLEECVNIALQKSQRKVVSDNQVKLAETRLWEVTRDLLPQAAFKYEPTTGKIDTGSGPRHYQGKTWKIEVKQNVFDGFGSWYKTNQYRENLEITKLEREKVKNEVIEGTQKAYYNLDKSGKIRNVQSEFKTKTNKLLEIMEGAYQYGLVPKVEYLKIKGQSAQADFRYVASDEDVKLAAMMLYQSMNIEPQEEINIEPLKEPNRELSIGLDNCYQLAFANRPDFKIKEKTIAYYEYERKIMKAKGWPKIEFQGSFGKAWESYQPTESDDERHKWAPEWYTGVKGSIPIYGNTMEYNYVREMWPPQVSSYRGTESATSYFTFRVLDDLAYFSGLQESRVGFESAKYEFEKAKNDILIEVKEIYFKYRKALLQMDVSSAQVEHQETYVGVLEERQRYGEVEVSKVVEEYEKLVENRFATIESNTNYYLSIAELNRAIGLPDYFSAEPENQEYLNWRQDVANNEAAKKVKKERPERIEKKRTADVVIEAPINAPANNFAKKKKK
ncbi:MAG: TolC family protein, partial [Candidatus Omnitrophica bacterium]|nr:TolC family protein [Candidatus Omnitrophota bacterium]